MENGSAPNLYLPVCVNYCSAPYKPRRYFKVLDKRTVLAFMILFAFFALTGFAYAEKCGSAAFLGIAESLNETDWHELLRRCTVYTGCLVLIISAAGMTVFGRIASIAAYSAVSFTAGAFTSCATSVYADQPLQSIILSALICAVIAFVDLFYCCGVFVFSKRAFGGKKDLFCLKPLLSYFCLSLISILLNTVFTFLLILKVK